MTLLLLPSKIQEPTYSVYIHYDDGHSPHGFKKWKLRGKTANINRAFKQAKGLYRRGGYSKVEIKKQSFDQKTKRQKSTLLRTYSKDRKKKFFERTLFFATVILYFCMLALLWLYLFHYA